LIDPLRLDDWPSKGKTRLMLIGSLLLAIVFNFVTAKQLILSNYPETGLIGPYPSWWFTFSGETLKSHYSVLIKQGTLNTFITVQYLDFGLMLTTGVFFFILAIVVARKHENNLFLRKYGFIAALVLAISPVMDLFENIFLIIMLSNPLEFPEWMAIVYSGFATAKVGFVTIGLLFVIMSSFVLGVKKITSWFSA
jgi:hypothetical protein